MKTKIFNNRTKLEALLAALLLICISSLSVYAGTRTISDTQDTFYRDFIYNSNGKYWTANASNLQSAIDDLTSGGTVYLPSGTITTDTNIDITTDNIAIKGSGIGSTIITTTSGGSFAGGIIYFNGGDDTPDGDELFNVSISDLTVVGVEGVNSVHGIYFRNGVWNGTISNVQVINPSSTGIYIDDSFNFIVDNVYVKEANNPATHAMCIQESNAGVINNVVIENCSGGDYAMDYSNAQNVTTSNVVMRDVRYGIKLDADESSNICRNNVFNNLVLHGTDGNAFHTGEGTLYTHVSDFVSYGFNKGFDLDSGCDYFWLSNAYVNGGSQEDDFSGDYVWITNFVKEGCSGNGFDFEGDHIHMTNSMMKGNAGVNGNKVQGENITISGCSFIDDTGGFGALSLVGCKNVCIDNCRMMGCYRGVHVADGCTHFSITDCLISGSTSNPIYLAAGSGTDYYRIIGNEWFDSGAIFRDLALGEHNVTANNLS